MAVVLCFGLRFRPRPFIKIKTKQNNNNKNLSCHTLEPLGARGWENILAALTATSVESIQGSVCLVVWEVRSLRLRVAGRGSLTRTRPGARAGRVSDIVFSLIEVSGSNSWKIGRAGRPFRGFHWAALRGSSQMNTGSSAKRRGSCAAGSNHSAGVRADLRELGSKHEYRCNRQTEEEKAE